MEDKKIVSSFEAKMDMNMYDSLLAEAEKDPRAKECGGFTKGQIGLLLRNQDYCEDPEKMFTLSSFYEAAATFSAPYFFDVQVMTGPAGLVYYKRSRNDFLVIESESVVSCTEKYFCEQNFIVKKVDQILVDSMIDNCYKNFSANQKTFPNVISDAIKLIDEKTGFAEPKIVILSSELKGRWNSVEINENLRLIPNFSDEYKCYTSNLVPKNKVIVMAKGGFVFCPYLIIGHSFENNAMKTLMPRIAAKTSRFGYKLLREGNRYFSVINVN